MIKTVITRSGHTVAYNREKIRNAIAAANVDAGSQMAERDVDAVTQQVEWDLQDHDSIGVEEIQDIVEQSS